MGARPFTTQVTPPALSAFGYFSGRILLYAWAALDFDTLI
jgi:hypothetical protein